MTRVGFYVVQVAEQNQRLQVAARLADKAFTRGHRIFINATDKGQAEALSELLWSFRPASFLPHGLCVSPRHRIADQQDARQRRVIFDEVPGI